VGVKTKQSEESGDLRGH